MRGSLQEIVEQHVGDTLVPELAARRVLREMDGPLDQTVPPIGRSQRATCSRSRSASG